MELKNTTDYTIFKKHPANAPLIEANVLRIMESIKVHNLLEFKPMLVNSSLEVMDGQHRLEAARRLGVAIYYLIQQHERVEDIRDLNVAQRQWGMDDYLNYYVKTGNSNYIKFQSFKKNNNMVTRDALMILRQRGRTWADNKEFKEGKFKFPGMEQIIESERTLANMNEVKEMIKSKAPHSLIKVSSAIFTTALLNFIMLKNMDFSVFKNKLLHKIDMLRPCPRKEDYNNLFKTIYNWRNQKPLGYTGVGMLELENED